MQLHNLELLSKVHESEGQGQYCCRVSDAWFRCLHQQPPHAAWRDERLAEAKAALQSMLAPAATSSTTAEESEHEADEVGAAPATSTLPAAATSGAAALQQVLRVANVTANTNYGEFPGPMCSPLCRKDIPQLRQHAYTVTEKSDGIRVVVVSLLVPDFPRWTVEAGEADTNAFDMSHLANVLALEDARHALHTNTGSTQNDEGAVIVIGGLVAATLQNADTPASAATSGHVALNTETYRLTLRAEGATPSVMSVHRSCSTGRHFAYAVDRSLDAAYLFLDDHTSPAYRDFVLDGELMCVREPAVADRDAGSKARLLLGAFDLFSYARHTEANGEEVKLVNATMMERYEALKALMATCDAPPSAPVAAARVTWYAKTMWRLTDLADCLAKLRYSCERHCFLFDGPHGATENDGLIFTPDVFPISVGSSSVQLKWKWRHLLSIDWLLVASDKQPDVYTVSLFFMKKNYGHREDVVGHWRLRKPMCIKNPHNLELPVDAAVVAECAYDFGQQQWYIQRLRPDKRGANSIVTAISVYESLVENISLPTLLALLHGDASEQERVDEAARLAAALEAAVQAEATAEAPPSTTSSSPPVPAFDVAQAEKSVTAAVTLRAIRESRGNTELYLNAYTNNTNKAVKFPLPFPLRKIRDCVGLGYDATTAATAVPSLEEALYIQLGNAGGCYAWSDFVVDACYNGETGYWELIHLNPRGNNKDAVFDNVIEHLDWLLRHRSTHRAEVEVVLQRKRDKPLVVAPAPRSEATRQTSRHYGAVAKELANAERSDLRRFNNWIKSVLISTVVAAVRTTLKDPAKLHAVDLCCGRGGDLLKWQHLHPAFVYMTDASVACVAEAAARYSTSEGQSLKSGGGKQRGFPAHFAVHDAFDAASGLRNDLVRRGPYQLISCQFSMHYGCRTEASMRTFVRAVADSLAVRGRFIGTTVSDAELLSRAKARGAAFGNDVYHVRFAEDAFAQVAAADFDPARLTFGVAYATTVERSVQDMAEYVVPWNAFVQLCAAHRLRLVSEDNFLHFYDEHKATAEGQALLREMRKKRGREEEASDALPLSAEEVEAVQLYRLFVFEKVDKNA